MCHFVGSQATTVTGKFLVSSEKCVDRKLSIAKWNQVSDSWKASCVRSGMDRLACGGKSSTLEESVHRLSCLVPETFETRPHAL